MLPNHGNAFGRVFIIIIIIVSSLLSNSYFPNKIAVEENLILSRFAPLWYTLQRQPLAHYAHIIKASDTLHLSPLHQPLHRKVPAHYLQGSNKIVCVSIKIYKYALCLLIVC